MAVACSRILASLRSKRVSAGCAARDVVEVRLMLYRTFVLSLTANTRASNIKRKPLRSQASPLISTHPPAGYTDSLITLASKVPRVNEIKGPLDSRFSASVVQAAACDIA